jgi:hypothetical protein
LEFGIGLGCYGVWWETIKGSCEGWDHFNNYKLSSFNYIFWYFKNPEHTYNI